MRKPAVTVRLFLRTVFSGSCIAVWKPISRPAFAADAVVLQDRLQPVPCFSVCHPGTPKTKLFIGCFFI